MQDNLPLRADQFDVLIIGGGPADVSCALECQDSRVSHLLIERNERLGGQLADITTEVPNFALSRGTGNELQERLEKACQESGINFVTNEAVVSIDLSARQVVTTQAVYSAKAIFIATGYRVKKLELPVDSDVETEIVYRTGEGQVCLAGRKVVIAGGGDSALLEALALVDTARSITVVHRSNRFKARPDVLEAVKSDERIKLLDNFQIESVNASSGAGVKGSFTKSPSISIRSTVDDSTQTIDFDKLVVKYGYVPNTELFAGQIEMDERGHIRVNQDCSTSVSAVFAGGDIASPGYDRIATAVGHGMVAAGSIRSLLEELSSPRPDGLLDALAKTARAADQSSIARV